jgi:hypothetical protein
MPRTPPGAKAGEAACGEIGAPKLRIGIEAQKETKGRRRTQRQLVVSTAAMARAYFMLRSFAMVAAA